MSTGGFEQAEWSPCIVLYIKVNAEYNNKSNKISFCVTCRFCRVVDPDGLGVGVAVEAAPLQEEVTLPAT